MANQKNTKFEAESIKIISKEDGNFEVVLSVNNKEKLDDNNRSEYPYSVRLNYTHLMAIRAISWYKRITQREFIEKLIGKYVIQNYSEKEMTDIVNKYQAQKEEED